MLLVSANVIRFYVEFLHKVWLDNNGVLFDIFVSSENLVVPETYNQSFHNYIPDLVLFKYGVFSLTKYMV